MSIKFSTSSLQQTLSDHHLPPFTNYSELSKEGARIITKGSGNYIYDNEGNKIFDAMAGLWCVNIGYGREELAEIAKTQMLNLPYYNSFFKARLSLFEEQFISKVLILDLWPLIMVIFDFGTSIKRETVLINSRFDAPLIGIAATFTYKTPEL